MSVVLYHYLKFRAFFARIIRYVSIFYRVIVVSRRAHAGIH